MTHNYCLIATLLAICAMTTIASSHHKDGTLTIHMDTTSRHDGIVDETKHEDILFDFIAKHINQGDVAWDKVWKFAELSTGEFTLYDKEGNVVVVNLHEGQHTTQSLRALLGMPAQGKAEETETIASHIGNSVDRAFLRMKEANRQKAASAAKARMAGKIASEVAAEVAQKVAKNVAKDVAKQIMSSNVDEVFDKSYWKGTSQVSTPETGGLKTTVTSTVTI